MEEATTTTRTALQLLELPYACLLRVLQRVAADSGDTNHRSLFSATRANSRLHAAATEALSALQVTADSQEQVDGALAFLARHGQHVSSVSMLHADDGSESNILISRLPSQCSQLRSLSLNGPAYGFDHWHAQLGPSDERGYPGVLHACAASLTRLEVKGGDLIDEQTQQQHWRH
jgi:hypothetical protein